MSCDGCLHGNKPQRSKSDRQLTQSGEIFLGYLVGRVPGLMGSRRSGQRFTVHQFSTGSTPALSSFFFALSPIGLLGHFLKAFNIQLLCQTTTSGRHNKGRHQEDSPESDANTPDLLHGGSLKEVESDLFLRLTSQCQCL